MIAALSCWFPGLILIFVVFYCCLFDSGFACLCLISLLYLAIISWWLNGLTCWLLCLCKLIACLLVALLL